MTKFKGTPFGYLSWLAFDTRNYEKAMFYMDTGIAEDVRKHKDPVNPTGWLVNPGPKFLTLDVDKSHGWFVRAEGQVTNFLRHNPRVPVHPLDSKLLRRPSRRGLFEPFKGWSPILQWMFNF